MYNFCLVYLVLIVITPEVLAESLYNEKNYESLVEDNKASKVGDSITIVVYENSQAGTSAGEGSSSDFRLSGAANVDERNWNTGVSLGAGNKGNAETKRNGFIKAQLTVMVVAIDEYGGLIVEGKQEITINDEIQQINIKGRVRPTDIQSNNVIPSFRLQDAQIGIDGEGSVSSDKSKNIIVRFFHWLGLH
jgi:flagellar L-ring protein precursor FlgH